MPRPESRKPAHRRRPAPIVESLEARQMLNATPVTDHASHHQVHAEVQKTKALAANLAKHEKAESTRAAAHQKATTAKAAHGQATQLTKTTKSKNPLIDLTRTVEIRPKTSKHKAFQVTYSPVQGAYTPAQLQEAYGVDLLAASDPLLGISNQGQGQTIAIIDELDDPNITADANAYSSYYGLPVFNTAGAPTFTVMKDQDLGTVTSAAGTGVAGETSLDVEVAHAMAPKANIILVEVPATGGVANQFKQLLEGVQYAASLPNVSVVSLSYGYPEANIGATNVKNLEAAYLAPGSPASKVAVTVSTGDGSTPLFPATTPDVIAVGGTSLYLNSAQGDYGYETAWGGLAGAGAGGGGYSTNFAQPAFQSAHGVTNANNKRSIPDISLVADPVTAVSIYDSLDVTTSAPSPWSATGGTSVAAPLFAGIVALAQFENTSLRATSYLTSAQIDNSLYTAYTNSSTYAAIINDVTLGNNKNVNSSGRTTVTGYTASTAYDLATGLGSPWAYEMVPYLVTGIIF